MGKFLLMAMFKRKALLSFPDAACVTTVLNPSNICFGNVPSALAYGTGLKICSKSGFWREILNASPSQSDQCILHSLGVPLHPSKHIVVKSCFWEPPQQGEIKINTDGAARGNPGKGGIGCIFRDSDAASNGWLISRIESDSKSTVEAFNLHNIPWVLEADWENEIRNMNQIRIFANWIVANFSVDDLSKRGANLQDGLKYLCKNILDSISFFLFALCNLAITSLL
ncbi:hypothetical protein GIB67_032150 [Kingdonia uniflora]|uniref:RNase H type-1 domain-containing protein n=1 Tax=Kingdonia uniflora TaxID=39325 RepID=A0A7J7MWR2_9MAGN|nr:hypothetical protein GIB67_032150 [Kingdonia uniflora]